MATNEKQTAGNSTGLFTLILALLLASAHFIFIYSYFQPVISTLDSHGYHVQAKQIAGTGKTYIVPESRVQYIGFTWNKDKTGRYITLWPPGYPLILASVYKIISPEAALLVNPIMASLLLLALFLVCRAWVGPGWGLLAMAITATNPFLNQHAHFGYSHVPATFFLMWGLYFLNGWIEKESVLQAFICGLLLGVIPSIRHLEIIFIPAFFIFAWLKSSRDNDVGNGLVPFLLGAAAPITALVIFNSIYFDTFFMSGYSLLGYTLPAMFKWGFFLRNSTAFLQKLLAEGAGLAFAPGIIGIVLLLMKRETWKHGLLMALLIIPLTLFYFSYFIAPNPQSMRFLIPTFPLYSICAVWMLRIISNGSRAKAAVLSVVLLVLATCWGAPQSVNKMRTLEKRNIKLVKITNILKEETEPGDVLIANEAICQSLDFSGRWKLIDVASISSERPEAYKSLKGEKFFEAFGNDVRKWTGKGRIYWLAKEGIIHQVERYLPKGDSLEPMVTIMLPRFRNNRGFENPRPVRPGRRYEREASPVLLDGLNMDAGPEYMNDKKYDSALTGDRLVLYEWKRGEETRRGKLIPK